MKTVRFLFLLLIVSCNYEAIHQQPGGAAAGGSGQDVCTPAESPTVEVVTYDQVRSQIFVSQCFSCHGNGAASGGVRLDTFEAARGWATQIKFDVVNNIMPKSPNPPLSQEGKDLVAAWVDGGAVNNVADVVACDENGNPGDGEEGGTTPAPPADEFLTEVPSDDQINYQLVRNKIFKFRCFSCHSTAGGNADGLNLETYFNAIDELEDIYEEVSRGSMPPAPRPALNDIERTTILRWVDLGAPNN